jgi:arylsulfatase A-like enzyme
MNNIKYLFALNFLYALSAFFLSGVFFAACKAQGDPPPNIIIILADDAGYADFGFMGSKDILSPNLDQLATEGVLFKQNYVSASVCSPSRAGLLTGKYQQRFGHECNLEAEQPFSFDTAQVTIAEALKAKGYQTAIFGKWHLGDYAHHHPLNNGFDHFWGFISGGRHYFPNEKEDTEGDLRSIRNDHNHDHFEGYLTDVLGDRAVQYIDKHKGNPFFMYLSFNAPHTPMDAKEDVLAKFKGKTDRPVYAAMLYSMDEAIGKVMDKLKEKGIYDNTLVFFLSDNGAAHNNQASSAPWKGWKGNEFEGGIRVPMIVSWPGKLKGNKTFTGMSSSLDIFTTALSAAGEKTKNYDADGKDLMPYLNGNDYAANVHEALYWRKDQMAAARIGDYKLLRLAGNKSVLYHLKSDLKEENDLTSTEKDSFGALTKKLMEWEAGLMKPIWTEPEDWNRVTYMIYEDLMQNRPIRVKAPDQLKRLMKDYPGQFSTVNDPKASD